MISMGTYIYMYNYVFNIYILYVHAWRLIFFNSYFKLNKKYKYFDFHY